MQRYSHGELVVVLDTSDLDRAAEFWTTVLGYHRDGYGGGAYLSLVPSSGQGVELLLQRTGDQKSDKNRCTWTCGPKTWTVRWREWRRPAVSA